MDSSLVNANLGVLSLAEIKHVQESKVLGSVEFGSVAVDEMVRMARFRKNVMEL